MTVALFLARATPCHGGRLSGLGVRAWCWESGGFALCDALRQLQLIVVLQPIGRSVLWQSGLC